MPEPPAVGWVTRFLFENPYPVGVTLLLVAAAMAWRGMREGRANVLKAAIVVAPLGGAVLLTGALVTTSGEHAKRVTRDLVDAAVASNVSAAMKCLASDATLSFGSPKNPSFDVNSIQQRLQRVLPRYQIKSNRITMLKGYSESWDAAVVHLVCWTEVEQGFGPMISSWVLRVEHQPDGWWEVTHLTCVSINNRTPTPNMMW